MKKISETIVFFGSGPVAAKSLSLLAEEFAIEAVITKPATEKEMAAILPNTPVFPVKDKASLSQLIKNKKFSRRIGVLIDFGIIVSQAVIDNFELGIVNSHFSVLPEWRGADPISWAILSGQATTGVSLMSLVEAMDEGPLLAYGELAIDDADARKLTDSLIDLSDALLKTMLPKYFRGEITPAPQSSTGRTVSYSRKLAKADGLIDWTKPADQITREIRAFIDWPKSRTTLGGREVIITKAHSVPFIDSKKKPGDIEVLRPQGVIMVTCADGYLCLDRLKPAGKKEMTVAEFLRGYGQNL